MSNDEAAQTCITVSEIEVQVQRKMIKNLHLSVCPPDGNVRVSAPMTMSNDNIRLAIVSRLSWIKRQQRDFSEQARQSERRFISGECHYFLGKRYRLALVDAGGKHEITALKSGKLRMRVHPATTTENKEKLLNHWYRDQLKQIIPELLAKWEPVIGREASHWGIKKMKTKWGSCNIGQKRIWLNLELAKKPPECLEYILVHELIHLLERSHNERFRALLTQFLPDWERRRKLLNTSPLAHENWEY